MSGAVVSAVALAIALALDATAVAAARGAVDRGAGRGVGLAVLFGGFQAGMAALGWLAGDAIGDLIERWDHWIAFALLAGLGIRMIVAGLRAAAPAPPAGRLELVGLAIATSIDAAAAGLTLPLIGAPIPLALVLIGAVTAVLSGVGYAAGARLGARFGRRLELVGGLALIAIGARILIGHLTA